MPTLAVTKISLPPNLKRRRQAVDDFLRHQRRVLRAHQVGEHDRELVAADARHRVAVRTVGLQPHRDLLQQLVAAGVAERVVDRLEAVEVDEQHRQRHLAALCLHDHLREAVGEQRAVGQPGERVELREVGKPASLSMRCSAVDSTLAVASAKFSSSAANAFGSLYADAQHAAHTVARRAPGAAPRCAGRAPTRNGSSRAVDQQRASPIRIASQHRRAAARTARAGLRAGVGDADQRAQHELARAAARSRGRPPPRRRAPRAPPGPRAVHQLGRLRCDERRPGRSARRAPGSAGCAACRLLGAHAARSGRARDATDDRAARWSRPVAGSNSTGKRRSHPCAGRR